MLRELKELGVQLAIDDFGTGYSSLAHLRGFPIDVLKIDRTFVDGLGRTPQDASIAAAIISLAHALGLQTIAEGIETDAQLELLTRPRLRRRPGLPVRATAADRRGGGAGRAAAVAALSLAASSRAKNSTIGCSDSCGRSMKYRCPVPCDGLQTARRGSGRRAGRCWRRG